MMTVAQDHPRPVLLKLVHCRPLRLLQGRQQAATLSRSHLITYSILALVGTTIFAVVEQSHGRAVRAQKAAEADVRPAAAEGQRPAVTPATAATPAASDSASEKTNEVLPPLQPPTAPVAPPAAAAGASEMASDKKSDAALPPQPPAEPIVGAAGAAAKWGSSGSEGPFVTGSFAPRGEASPSSAAVADTSPQAAQRTITAPVNCRLPALHAVLADVSARFGAVTIVATHQVTPNHTAGSYREKLHHDCKAIDFRPDRSRVDEITAYLRSRPEIGGVDSYRDGVIHMDLSAAPVAKAAPPKPAAVAQTKPPPTTPAALTTPAAPTTPADR